MNGRLAFHAVFPLAAILSIAAGLQAQSADSIPLMAVMQASNEVPALTDGSNAVAIIWVHSVRDNAGAIVSGSVDFDISTRFSGAVTATGLHIHNGAAGVNGPVVIPTDVNGTDKSIAVDATGKLRIQKQVTFPQTNPTVATIRDMLANPQNYYVNIHTTVNAGGAMRAQLMKADLKVLMGLMSTANEVPPVTGNGSAIATITMVKAVDAQGSTAAAATTFNIQYTGFDAGTVFTGLHIHGAPLGANGPVIINTGVGGGTASVAADPSGTGTLNYLVPMSPLDASWAAEAAAVNGTFASANSYYVNMHTTTFAGGMVRDQLRSTEKSVFQVNMLPANEVPPTGLNANGQSAVSAYLLRNADGTVGAATMLFDVNYTGLGAATTITGLHVHQSAAGTNGGIVFPAPVDAAANKIVSDTGIGNVFKFATLNSSTAVNALNQLVLDPSGFYLNIHTTVNAGGAMRTQLAGALKAPSLAGFQTASTLLSGAAPGSVVAVYGSNLAGYSSDNSGFYGQKSLVTSLNGVSVTVGGVKAPFYYVSPNQLNIQVPLEIAPGSQPVVVTTPAGTSTPLSISLAPVAPGILVVDFPTSLGVVVKNSDFSLITPANPAKAGDAIVIYSTGLGLTTPGTTTGTLLQPPANGFNNTGTAAVTIGTANATVIYSIAAPGFAGLFQTAVTVPPGVSGNLPLVLKIGGQTSNTVNVSIQ